MLDVDPSVVLAPDWHPVDTAGREPFRWLTGDAIVRVQTVERIEHRVSVDVEGDVGTQSPVLNVLDAENRLVAEAVVETRRIFQFLLPAGPPTLHILRLRPQGGANARLRVFDIRAEPQRPDVVPLHAGIHVGRGGWHMLQERDGEAFRWVDNDAEIVVRNPAATALELDIEPGPDLTVPPLILDVLHRGRSHAQFAIGARRRIQVGLPHRCTTPYTVTLHAHHGGGQKPGNLRILNFRLMHIPPA